MLHLSLDLSNLNDYVTLYFPENLLIHKTYNNILDQLLKKLIGEKLYELIDGFLSPEDPLYYSINEWLYNDEKIYSIYFTEESLYNLKNILTIYIKNIYNGKRTDDNCP